MFRILFKTKIIKFVILLICFAILPLKLCLADSISETPDAVSWHIWAERIIYDHEQNTYIAENNVIITGGRTRLEADYLEFANNTKEAVARGNVLLKSGEDSISCDEMQLNLLTEEGVIPKGRIFVQKNHLYLQGENIRKTGKFAYSAVKGSITSCSGDTPDWKITGKDINVTIEGYGYATNAALWIKKIPVLYTPFILFPAKTKRQTGLLTPKFGFSSNRLGFQYEQPLFIAFAENIDATLYSDYMSLRGIKIGSELQYALSASSKGTLFFDILNDDKLGNSDLQNINYSFISTPDRTNTSRYWLRMKNNQELPMGFNAKLDLDIVSDTDYLHEFKDGYTGYIAVNKQFQEIFGRDLDAFDDTTRQNSLTFEKTWDNMSLVGKALWYDNVIARQDDIIKDFTLQTLPSVEFNICRSKLSDSGFYYTLDSEFRSFYRQDTTPWKSERKEYKIKGERMDVHSKIYYPVRLAKGISFEPHAGLRGTLWHTDDFINANGEKEDLMSRGIYDIGMQLSSKMNRIFVLDNDFADKIKHEITFDLEYGYQPHVFQNDLPYFDSIDEIEEKNFIRWSITHTFIGKNVWKKWKKQKGANKMLSSSNSEHEEYREIAWFKFHQDYDISNGRYDNEIAHENAWSDLKFESEINLIKCLSMELAVDYSPYDYHFKKINAGGILGNIRGDTLTMAYRYDYNDAKPIESLYNRFFVNLSESVGIYYSFEQNLEARKMIETIFGLAINKPCWGLRTEYSKGETNKQIGFTVILKGIGESN